jgi:ankyrin repeat protein
MANSKKHTNALFKAAESGAVEELKKLLRSGAEINTRTNDSVDEGQTPLFVAANYGNYECVVELLKAGSDVNLRTFCPQAPGRNGGTILHIHLLNDELKDTRILEALLEAGAEMDVPMVSGLTPLGQAASVRNFNAVKLLLERGAKSYLTAGKESVVLSEGAQAGDLRVVDLLLKAGAPPDILNDFKMTPLMFACERGHSEIVQLLLKKKAYVNAKDAKLRTPFHHLCYYADRSRSEKIDKVSVSIGEMLVGAGAEIDLPDVDGKKPVDYLDYIAKDTAFPIWLNEKLNLAR